MEKIEWIKNLVKAEQQMEESGLVDISFGFDQDRALITETIQFLLTLKTEFVDSSSTFNELKASALGRIKIYGIAKTHADFMLFRNGFKMIFSMKSPGQISIRFNFIGTNFATGPQMLTGQKDVSANQSVVQDEQLIEAKWGPFHEIMWTFNGQPFKAAYLVRYYMTLFLKESAK